MSGQEGKFHQYGFDGVESFVVLPVKKVIDYLGTIEAYQEGALRIVENIITLDIWWDKSKLCSTFTINDPESAGVSWDSRGIKLGHVYEDNLPEFESEEGWKRVLQREVGELLDGFA